jgi:hypothetical protein
MNQWVNSSSLIPRLLRLFERRALVVRGHAVVFISPVAEVEQFAAFGTERAMRVVLPFDGFVTGRTLLHKALTAGRGETGKGKGKSSVQAHLLLPFL